MKSINEIFIRTVILQCLTNRVCLETQVGGAQVLTDKEREDTRCDILHWLNKNGYYSYTTAKEKWLFELPVGMHIFKKDELNEIDVQCKAMDVFMWVLGKSERITELSLCEIGEFHEQLGISPNHVMENELARCNLRPADEIALQADIAFLWNWRINEVDQYATKGKGHHITDMVIEQFGGRYTEAVKHISIYTPPTPRSSNDFVEWNLVIRELYKWQLRCMKWFTQWRHHAFVWMLNDITWDDFSRD